MGREEKCSRTVLPAKGAGTAPVKTGWEKETCWGLRVAKKALQRPSKVLEVAGRTTCPIAQPSRGRGLGQLFRSSHAAGAAVAGGAAGGA